MGEVIVITSGKGGVGKTTTTANLGAALAMLGKSVVLVDADIGLRNLDVVMGLENRIVYDLVDVVEQKCRLRQACVRDKRYESLYLLAASQTREKDDITPEQMQLLCRELRENYDYVLIDCPAGIEQGFANAVAGADSAVVVTTPEMSAVRDADKILGRLETEHIENRRLLINRMRSDMVKKGNMLSTAEMVDILAVALLGVVPEDEAVIVSNSKGEPAVENGKSRAGLAYRNIARRLTGCEVPLMDIADTGSVWYKIKKAFCR